MCKIEVYAESPSVMVTQEPPKPSQVKKLVKPVSLILLLILALTGAWFYLPKYFSLNNFKKLPIAKTNTLKSNPINAAEAAIKKTFAKSAQYQEIVKLINIAASEKDINRRYDYYLTVFNKVSQAYVETQDPSYKLVLYKLQDYLKIYPQYNNIDVIVPELDGIAK